MLTCHYNHSVSIYKQARTVHYSIYLVHDLPCTWFTLPWVTLELPLSYLRPMYYEVSTIKKTREFQICESPCWFTVRLTRNNDPVSLALSNECRAASLCSSELPPVKSVRPLSVCLTAPKLIFHIRPNRTVPHKNLSLQYIQSYCLALERFSLFHSHFQGFQNQPHTPGPPQVSRTLFGLSQVSRRQSVSLSVCRSSFHRKLFIQRTLLSLL